MTWQKEDDMWESTPTMKCFTVTDAERKSNIVAIIRIYSPRLGWRWGAEGYAGWQFANTRSEAVSKAIPWYRKTTNAA
jgi:hypothetical protein